MKASVDLPLRAQDVVSSSFPPLSVPVLRPPAAVFSIAAGTAEGTEKHTRTANDSGGTIIYQYWVIEFEPLRQNLISLPILGSSGTVFRYKSRAALKVSTEHPVLFRIWTGRLLKI